MKINIVNSFNNIDYSSVINKVISKAANHLKINNKAINVILVDNEEIKRLNSSYRQKEYVTDVLTFPDGYLGNLGDIFISVPKCEEQSSDLGHSFNRELGFLVVHGLLHSLGYDHQTENEEEVMNTLQNEILNLAKLYR